jgi:hypothetical protein
MMRGEQAAMATQDEAARVFGQEQAYSIRYLANGRLASDSSDGFGRAMGIMTRMSEALPTVRF